MNQKVGIVCDNYKLRRFKRALKKAGFEYSTKPFLVGTTTIFVHTTDDRIKEIEKICKTVQIDVTRGN